MGANYKLSRLFLFFVPQHRRVNFQAMARRGAATAEPSSQEENNPPPSAKVKSEKVKDSAKEEGSSKKHKGKQRAPLDDAGQEHDTFNEEEDDAEGEEDFDGDEQDGSPKGRKRARVNDNGDAISNNGENSAQPRERIVTLPRDTDGYVISLCSLGFLSS